MDLARIAAQQGISVEDVPELLFEWASSTYERYQESSDENDIKAAVTFARESIRATADDDESLPDRLNEVTAMLASWYEQSGDPVHLEAGIDAARRALRLTPAHDPGDAARAVPLHHLGSLLESRYTRSGDAGDLEEAIDLARQALHATPRVDVDFPDMLAELGSRLHRRFRVQGTAEDFEESARCASEAVDCTDEDDPRLPALLSDLSARLAEKPQQDGDDSDLRKAVEFGRRAIELTPPDDPDQATWASNLCNRLYQLYHRVGGTALIEEAIELGRKAVGLSPPDRVVERNVYLNNLSNALERKFLYTGDIKYLEESIRMLRQAVSLLPPGHENRPTWQHNLSAKVERSYEATGIIGHLEESIKIARQVVADTGPTHVYYATAMASLGSKLQRWCDETGSSVDMDEAIVATREAIRLTGAGRADYHLWCSNFGNWLVDRYDRTKAVEDLAEAIRMGRSALEHAPPSGPSRPQVLHNLARALYQKAVSDCDTTLLDEAIEKQKEALRLAPEEVHDKSSKLSSLASMMRFRYDQEGDMDDLEEAIKLARSAVASTKEGHPAEAYVLERLAHAVATRHLRTGDSADVTEAVQLLLAAWSCASATPFDRLKCGRQCLALLVAQGSYEGAASLGKDMMALLPTVFANLPNRTDQQYVMSAFAGIASDLCTVLIEAGHVQEALGYLEQGRAVIISQLLDRRSDLAVLSETHPDLAHEYHRLAGLVNSHFRSSDDEAVEKEVIRRRREASQQLMSCLGSLRKLQGHERFLLGQTVAEMQQCAVGGTIVAVNVTTLSHALIVSRAEVRAVPLPDLSMDDLEPWVPKDLADNRSMANTIGTTKHRSTLGVAARDGKLISFNLEDLSLSGYLARVWSKCVRVILTELGIHGPSAVEEMPRIWWMGTGSASAVPFHAAGDMSLGPTENTMSWVLSSYTPTIKALRHAVERSNRRTISEHSVLLVTMPRTPGYRDLPAVTEEAASILASWPNRDQIKTFDRPSKATVLSHLPDSSIVHFAGHGVSDVLNPSQSFLALQGEASATAAEPELERLTVQEVLDASRPGSAAAWLAYLSACSTAASDAAPLVDESLHLASGFHVAGFAHVVAALWPSRDDICAQVAGGFYRELFARSGGGGGRGGAGEGSEARKVAEALHTTVWEVRAESIDRPYLWAQYIHSGA